MASYLFNPTKKLILFRHSKVKEVSQKNFSKENYINYLLDLQKKGFRVTEELAYVRRNGEEINKKYLTLFDGSENWPRQKEVLPKNE